VDRIRPRLGAGRGGQDRDRLPAGPPLTYQLNRSPSRNTRFRVLAQHPPQRGHRSSHPVRVAGGARAWWYLYPNYRVPDDWRAIQDARSYEAYVCDAAGCAWKPGAPFIDGAEEERKLIAGGKLPAEAARFPFIDVDTGKPAAFGMGSIAWNAHRKRWIMIAGAWGDVYYSEASAPEGRWRCAKKIVRHEKYNFYNVVHHPFFGRIEGRAADLLTSGTEPWTSSRTDCGRARPGRPPI
jgi:hypothetical protein